MFAEGFVNLTVIIKEIKKKQDAYFCTFNKAIQPIISEQKLKSYIRLIALNVLYLHSAGGD